MGGFEGGALALPEPLVKYHSFYTWTLTGRRNPGLEQWIGELCGAQVALPTAGLACIDFGASDWTRINRGAGQLRFYLIPRLLKAMEQQE